MLIQPNTHQLVFQAYTAFFRIVNASWAPYSFLADKSEVLRHLNILDLNGFIAGTVYVPMNLIGMLKSEHQEFICLSRRRSSIVDDGPVPQSPEDDFRNIPNRATLYPYSSSQGANKAEFDHRRYNRYKPWPLYNVMMIERENDIASRIALGLMHVTAFVQARPVKKLITLV